MKRTIVAIFATALVTIVCWYAAGTLRRGEVSSATPRLGSLEAVVIASRLEVGMSERRIQKLLNDQGIPCRISLGCSHSWTRFGELTNGCSLALEMRPTGFLGGGRLQAAYIQSNGVNVVKINLRDSR